MRLLIAVPIFVMPAKAGIHSESAWTPAYGFPSKYYFDGVPAGVTGER
jgi:hypothetical protein